MNEFNLIISASDAAYRNIIASAVSSYPTLNLILYIPEANQSPLRIHNSKGSYNRLLITVSQNQEDYMLTHFETILGHPIDNNAFLIPRWGGIVISNPQTTNNSYTLTVEELKPIIEIFISQLRGLLGVRKFTSDDKVNLTPRYSLVFFCTY